MTNQRVVTGTDIFEELLSSITEPPDKRIYPFMLRVGCVKMAAPRHKRFEFILDVGYADIERVLYNRPLRKTVLTFVFPERHMSVHEQHAFMTRMVEHKEAKHIERVDMLTSSPLLISNFQRHSIRILTWPDDCLHAGAGVQLEKEGNEDD